MWNLGGFVLLEGRSKGVVRQDSPGWLPAPPQAGKELPHCMPLSQVSTRCSVHFPPTPKAKGWPSNALRRPLTPREAGLEPRDPPMLSGAPSGWEVYRLLLSQRSSVQLKPINSLSCHHRLNESILHCASSLWEKKNLLPLAHPMWLASVCFQELLF